MEPRWHQQQQMRPYACGAALSWTLHGGGSGKRLVQPKAALSIKASVEDQLITSVFMFAFFIFLIKSCLSSPCVTSVSGFLKGPLLCLRARMSILWEP